MLIATVAECRDMLHILLLPEKKSLVIKLCINLEKYREYMPGFAFVDLVGFLFLYQIQILFSQDYYVYVFMHFS